MLFFFFFYSRSTMINYLCFWKDEIGRGDPSRWFLNKTRTSDWNQFDLRQTFLKGFVPEQKECAINLKYLHVGPLGEVKEKTVTLLTCRLTVEIIGEAPHHTKSAGAERSAIFDGSLQPDHFYR